MLLRNGDQEVIANAIYQIRAENGALLVSEDDLLCTGDTNNPVYFVPLDHRNAILVPSANLAAWSGEGRAVIWGYDEDAHKGALIIVKYSESPENEIHIMGWRRRLYYRANSDVEQNPQKMAPMTTAPESGCKFTLEKAQVAVADLRKDLSSLRRFLTTGVDTDIEFTKLHRYVIELFMQILPPDELESKIDTFIKQDGISRLKQLFPEDKIARYGFNQEPMARVGIMDEDYDFLGDIWLKYNPVSAPHIINQVYRKKITKDRRSCVVTTARNEGPYIVEFIAYYKALGFEEIFIYSNDNTDGSDSLLRSLAEAGQIYYMENRGGPGATAQGRGYTHAVNLNYELPHFKWTLMADADEFLYLNFSLFEDLNDFLDFHERQGTESIGFNWLSVSSNGQMAWDGRPVIERFPYCLLEPDANIKSMFRSSFASSMQCHFPIASHGHNMVYRNACGARYSNSQFSHYHKYALAFSDVKTYSHAAMLHYIYKSFDEFIYKMGRNTGARQITRTICFDILDLYRMQRFIGQFDVKPGSAKLIDPVLLTKTMENMAQIRQLPGVADAEKRSVDKFLALLPTYKREFLRHIEADPALQEAYQMLMDAAARRTGYQLLPDN